jgi:hypothetical protein
MKRAAKDPRIFAKSVKYLRRPFLCGDGGGGGGVVGSGSIDPPCALFCKGGDCGFCFRFGRGFRFLGFFMMTESASVFFGAW